MPATRLERMRSFFAVLQRPSPGFFLYYPTRRHMPPALAALVAALPSPGA